tara:strand:+ start:548 stop:868 length:321 start_codon:yes stop_codon:yes gene_type:complete
MDTITTNDIATALAGSGWRSYCNTSIRHGDRSESEVHTRPLAGHGWEGILVWRVMYRAPHDKRQRSTLWPRQVVAACGFAHSKEDAEKAARAAVRAHTKSIKEAAA